MVALVWIISVWEVNTGGAGDQGCIKLYIKLEASCAVTPASMAPSQERTAAPVIY